MMPNDVRMTLAITIIMSAEDDMFAPIWFMPAVEAFAPSVSVVSKYVAITTIELLRMWRIMGNHKDLLHHRR